MRSHGNGLVACAFPHGLDAEELTRAELDAQDPEYPVPITIRAVKRGATDAGVGALAGAHPFTPRNVTANRPVPANHPCAGTRSSVAWACEIFRRKS